MKKQIPWSSLIEISSYTAPQGHYAALYEKVIDSRDDDDITM